MSDLSFSVIGARAVAFAATPQLTLDVRVANTPATERVQAIVRRVQTRIEAQKLALTKDDRARLVDLFGDDDVFARTPKSILWSTTSLIVVPPFAGDVTVEHALPCSLDLNVASARLLFALADHDVPLTLLFSGTIFHHVEEESPLAIAQIPWTKEAAYALPITIYRSALDAVFPNSAFVPLHRDVFERLVAYKTKTKSLSWDETIDALLGRTP